MTKDEFNKILEWLYVHDGGYNDKLKWRKEFVEMLENLVVSTNMDCVNVENIVPYSPENKLHSTDFSHDCRKGCCTAEIIPLKFSIWKTIEIGGKKVADLLDELKEGGFKVSDYAKSMMESKGFTVLEKPETINLIRLSISDLFGDQDVHTTDDIYKKANQLGLELCPAEVGLHLRLKLTDQAMGEWFRIAMKQIAGPGGYPSVFDLGHDGGGLWLNGSWTRPMSEWVPESRFVFRLRK